MGERSPIEWTDRTWNPVTGCTKVSPGCQRCYAGTFAERWRGIPAHPYEHGFDLTLRPERLAQPLGWRSPSRVFVCSMADLLHDLVPDEYVARVFAVMALAGRHTFQVLTKRHGRLRSLLGRDDFRQAVARHASDLIASRPWRRWQLDLGGARLAGDSGLGGGWTTTPTPAGNQWTPPWPLPNVWLGVSVEDQKWADIRIPTLLDTPGTVRWLSCEPLLGPLDLTAFLRPWPGHCQTCGTRLDPPHATACTGCGACDGDDGPAELRRFTRPDWVIVGGESGPGARAMDLDWAREVVEQCRAASVAVFVKQAGADFARANGLHRIDPKGGNPRYWPADLRIRRYPTVGGRAVR